MKIKTIKQLKAIIEDLPDDFEVDMKIYSKIDEERLSKMSYRYPYDIVHTNLSFDDIGHSENKICFSVSIPTNE